MIPFRPAPAPEPPESIQSRLARLRVEQRRAARFTTCRAQPANGIAMTSSSSSHLSSALLMSVQQDLRHDVRRRRAAAGPPAPRSWSSTGMEAVLNQHRSRSRSSHSIDALDSKSALAIIKSQQIYRDRLLQPLEDSPSTRGSNWTSLSSACEQLIVQDLARPSDRSITLGLVHLLPNHLRLRLFDQAACRGFAVEERAILELLRPAESSDHVGDHLQIVDNFGRLDVSDPMTGSAEIENEDEWESQQDDDQTTPTVEVSSALGWTPVASVDTYFPFKALTSLNLAFSAISLPFLSSLLLSTRGVPVFAHLATLNLAATPRLPFVDSFFKLLATLISLRHLSLAGKRVQLHDRMMTWSSFLARLVASTPTLISLDLSYLELPYELLTNVDWDRRWLDLIKLGIRTEYKLSTSARLKLLKDIRASIENKGATKRKRKMGRIVSLIKMISLLLK